MKTGGQALFTRHNRLSKCSIKLARPFKKERELADHSLRQDISLINQTLSQLETMNQKLSQTAPLSSQQAGLRDQQDLLLQDLAQFLPFKQIERAHGAVALYTAKGQILLDSHAAELAISETGFGQKAVFQILRRFSQTDIGMVWITV